MLSPSITRYVGSPFKPWLKIWSPVLWLERNSVATISFPKASLATIPLPVPPLEGGIKYLTTGYSAPAATPVIVPKVPIASAIRCIDKIPTFFQFHLILPFVFGIW